MPFQWWQIILIIGASIRLTRLVVDDSLLEPFRFWVEGKESDDRGYYGTISFTTLINCTWCTGMWISAGVVGLSVAWHGFYWMWLILGVSQVVGIEATLREKL